MSLTNKQMTRLGELLDECLHLPMEERRSWLAALAPEDEPLRRTLSDALLSENPAPLATQMLDRSPGSPTRDSEHRAGERLGAYELVEPLGIGGMAEVWLARRADGAFERQVALKIPRLHQLPEEMAARFARECRILASLEVPGIARLYDAGVDERGFPYIAMEYVSGEPLSTWCDAHGLGCAQRVALFVQVVEAVASAHSRQVIHRDLKPSNILVTRQGEVRLLDFGVARLLQSEADGASLTQAWGRAMTPAYASPEMLRGADVDARSDIYSLGVILQELLARTPDIPDGLRSARDKALSRSPDDRFASAAEFAAALQPFVQPRSARMRPLVRAALVGGIVAILLTTGLLLMRSPRPAAGVAAAPAQPAQVSLAVLPFTDLSPARDQAYLSEGMADEIINQLAQIPALRLTGLRSSLLFRDRNEDLRVIGEKLGVDNLLDGTIRKDGERLRITAQLVRARDRTPLWSKVYERQLRDVFSLQEEIAREVAQALPVKLDVGPMSRSQGGTTNLEAYERYLHWRQMFLAERHAFEDHRRRVQLLRDAVQLDPGFVLAWGELASELDYLRFDLDPASYPPGGGQIASLKAEAERARARVLALAPESWMGLRVRSEQLANEKRWAESMGVARRILDTGPFTLERAYPYTNVLFAVGHLDETVELVERVIRIEPLAMFPSRDQQWNLTGARRMRDAAVEYERSRNFEGAHVLPDFIAFLRELSRQPADLPALRASYAALKKHYDGAPRPSLLLDLEPLLGDRAAMLARVRRTIEAKEPGWDNAFNLADALGDGELALKSVQALTTRNDRDFTKYWELWIMPYSNVRTLPGFKQILREAGIVDYWRSTGKWGDHCRPLGADDFECR